MNRIEYRSNILDTLEACKTAMCAGDYRGLARLLSGSYMGDLWAAAITATYGPTGLHPSRCDTSGAPTEETLRAYPRVAQAMAEAREDIVCLIRWYERNAGR